MRFAYLLSISLFLTKANLLPVPQPALSPNDTEYDDVQQTHSNAHSENSGMSDYTAVLQEELDSMGILAPSKQHHDYNFDRDDDVFIIPRIHISERILNRLGYKDLVKYSKKFKLSNHAFKTDLEILVPETTIPYFVFNTSDPLQIPHSQSKQEYARFIDHSAPFELPKFSTLVDYFLVLPIPESFNPNFIPSDILTAKRQDLPLFNHALKDQEAIPLTVFLFRSGEDAAKAREEDLPLLGVKNYLGEQELNVFFDIFAQSWIEDVGYNQLLSGVFCTLNVEATQQSFCIKIKEDMNNLVLFPAYSHEKTNHEMSKRFNGDDALIDDYHTREHQNNRSVIDHEKRSGDDDGNFQELVLPLSIVKESDSEYAEEEDDESPRSSAYAQVITKSNIRNKNHGKRGIDNDSFTNAQVEKIRERLDERRRQKKLKDVKNKALNNSDAFVRSKLNKEIEKIDTEENKHKMNVEQGKERTSVIKTYGRPKVKPQLFEQEKQQVEEWKAEKKKEEMDKVRLVSSSSTNHIKNSTSSQHGQDCEPITWFNVFHHSVFGKTKFCGL